MAVAEIASKRPGKAAILRAAIEVIGESGYDGASTRDMAARAGVSVAAVYYHFPSKLDLLRQFLDEAYDVILARLDRRLAAVDPSPPARLDEIVSTLIASHLHDRFARLASIVAFREYTRLNGPDREAIEQKRDRLLLLVADVIAAGVASGDFHIAEPDEAARAVITLATSVVGPFAEMRRPLHEVITLYQGFVRNLCG